ncbi:HTH-type transcriptional regulator MalT [Marinomonas spartinae]|uniref:HTH-type transcriptional regulator MalT n=1 Tax=Marinomonas spartinae TaxID=1792290 RepID=A0A1A8TSE0_9GAMM|nr:LuxR family transcriptional regulator [Marinomonas spartinae]SBS36226.1 HTH-type transcriptional regulator MalT [Marinomonas spartinae]
MSQHYKNGQISPSDLMKDLAVVTNHLHIHSFPCVLESFLSGLCYFDDINLITYKKTFKPILIHPNITPEENPTLHAYLHNFYLLDPLFNAIQQGVSSGIHRLADLAPDSFEQTRYYQQCYQAFDLVDEINILISLNRSTTFAITLGRQKTVGSILRSELNNLKMVYPMIESLVQQFWLAQSQNYVDNVRKNSPLKQALTTFAKGALTDREQEVLGLLLKGHSSKSIADQLGISVGTIKVHRKNIHSRLNTNNQADIFTLFLKHLEGLEPLIA